MNSKELKTVLVNFIDILLLLSLLAVAVYFMHNCIIKFTDKTTYFEIQAQEKVGLESPTLHSALRGLKNIFGFFDQDVISSVER